MSLRESDYSTICSRFPNPTTATMSSSILTLSPELMNKILEQSDYSSRLALSCTSKSLRSQTSMAASRGSMSVQISNESYDMSDLLIVEKWPCHDFVGQREDGVKQPSATEDFFACSLCLKIRCASKFSNAMMKGKRGKHSDAASVDRDERRKRFCIDCGVRYGRYLPGVMFDFGGSVVSLWKDGDREELGGGYGLVCRQCRKFKRVDVLSRPEEQTCRACLVTTRRL